MSSTHHVSHDLTDGDVQLRACDAAEFAAFHERMMWTLGVDVVPAARELEAGIFEPDRALVGVDDGRIVATAALASRCMTVPGAVVSIAAVMMMSVAPTHRRRGLLTRLVRQQLEDVHAAGNEAVAALWSAEAGIYGRFGYGLATRRAVMTGATHELVVRPDLVLDGVRFRQPAVEEALLTMAALYEELRLRRTGWLDRRGGWWPYHLAAPHGNGGWSDMRVVVCEDMSGRTVGYALYAMRAEWSVEPTCEVLVREIAATSPGAYASLWKFLVELDLVRSIRRDIGPVDEPLQHMVLDARAVRLALEDGVWVRLVDVDKALTQRRYATEVDVVVEVIDRFCPWNQGRWRLTGGPDGAVCERAGSSSDLVMGPSELGAAYLGSTSLSALGAAGRVEERTAGALAHLSRAMRSDTLVFCPEHF